MKLAFLALVLANVLVYAWQHGLLGFTPESGREPQRTAQQIAPESLRVLTAAEIAKLRSVAQPSKDSAVTLSQSCIEFGDFSGEVLAQVQPRIDALGLKDRLATVQVEAPGWYLVYMPPMKTRAEADARARDLRQQSGVKDLFVIGEASPMRNGIALGSFRDRELASGFLAELESRGVKGARLADKPSTVGATRFRVRDVDPTLAQQLTRLQEDFPQQKLAPCSS
ncbi:MAG TPA: hypothetical protein VM528_08295 [Burkholderiaceae bacterium]|jgi:hypothetical protein|nr:hypothetical protein [Burkholderiaceae bacterium]